MNEEQFQIANEISNAIRFMVLDKLNNLENMEMESKVTISLEAIAMFIATILLRDLLKEGIIKREEIISAFTKRITYYADKIAAGEIKEFYRH